MSPNWAGVFCALWTPTGPKAEILDDALTATLTRLKSAGVRGVLALGSTGEFLHLDPAQRKAFIETVVASAGPLRVIMNITDLRPGVVADLGQFAGRSGAAAVSLLPPYFFPVAQVDLVEWFVRGAEAAGLPLFIYNFPERVGNRVALETIAAVADRVPVAGVKQSGSEFKYHTDLVRLGREKNFVVLTGADTRLPEAMQLGAAGCVSGLANAVPDLVTGSYESAQLGEPMTANVAATRLTELGRLIGEVQFPLDVAACMEARGMTVGTSKSLMSPTTQATYRRLIEKLRGRFQEWGLI